MSGKLAGKTIAILVANGFEQSEMTDPKKALEAEGATTEVISPEKNKVKGWKNDNWADEFSIDVALSEADDKDYDALILPGGVMNPDKLRMNPEAITFIKKFISTKKPIAAICHGPWTLINAEMVKGYKMTSWPSLKMDLTHAGAEWVDQECVVDENLVTSRKPEDIPAFNKAIIELIVKADK